MAAEDGKGPFFANQGDKGKISPESKWIKDSSVFPTPTLKLRCHCWAKGEPGSFSNSCQPSCVTNTGRCLGFWSYTCGVGLHEWHGHGMDRIGNVVMIPGRVIQIQWLMLILTYMYINICVYWSLSLMYEYPTWYMYTVYNYRSCVSLSEVL